MTYISLKQSKMIVNAASGAFFLLGLIAGVKSDNQLGKNIAWTIAASSAVVAFANSTATNFHEDKANEQAERLISARDAKIKSLEDKTQKFEQLQIEYTALAAYHTDIAAQLERVTKLRSAETDRFNKVVTTFISEIKYSLTNHIETNAVRLVDAINGRIRVIKDKTQSDDSQHILKILNKLIPEVEHKKKLHLVWVKELEYKPDSDINTTLTDVLDLITQIHDEIQATRSKYRNTLVIGDRLKLRESVHKSQAVNALRNLKATADEELENINQKTAEYEEVTANNDKFVQNLIKDFEGLRLRLAQKDDVIKELQAPITWKFSLNQATKTGNIIITWCQGRGIHLDRSHYTGDRYEADLYFFTDRINAAQTIDLKTLNEEGENLAQIAHCLEPIKFTYEYDTRLVVAHIVMLKREKQAKTVDDFLQPANKLIEFVKSSYHIGLWGATGRGKTTAISNIIGGMISDLGGTPIIKTTVPKIEDDTRKIFPVADWVGIPNSIFGLLEAGLEIQYRIHANEQAYINNEPFPEFEPIVFFIDEINLIFGRWKKINDSDMTDVLDRFERTLTGQRLQYYQQYMKTELENYKGEFAKRLLLFTWQTGRSLKVKSLISGQNLQPGAFGVMKNDLANCAYVAFGDAAKSCKEYKVDNYQEDEIERQRTMIEKTLPNREELKYTALYCPNFGKAYFGILPPPNYYQWDKNLLLKSQNEHNNQPIVLKSEPVVHQSLDNRQGISYGLFNGFDSEPNEKCKHNANTINPESLYTNSSGLEYEPGTLLKSTENGQNDPNPTQPALTQAEIDLININSNKPTSDIVFEVWGLKPSKSKRYLTLKNIVETVLNRVSE